MANWSPTDNWRKMSVIYRIFAEDHSDLDWSDEAAVEMYRYETHGHRVVGANRNGYWIGKHWMDVTIEMWLRDLRDGLLFKNELYSGFAAEHHWWLDKVLKPAGPFGGPKFLEAN